MKISFVIPCYNSAKTITMVVHEIIQTVQQRPKYDYEIILVDDYSKDDTAQVITALAKNSDKIKAVLFAKNFGQPSAIMAGFQFVTGDYVVTSDDDGQTPINIVYKFIDKMNEEKFDVVCAKYIEREQPSAFRRFGSRMNEKMSNWLIKKPEGIYMSAYICARPFVIKELLKYRHSYPYLAGLILRVTQNIGNVETKQRERNAGSSNYTIKKLLHLWLNGFTAFSIRPLRVSVLVGMICSGLGFLLALMAIVRKLININIQSGWSSMIALMLIIGGMILLSLGMIGEYVGRIYMCINDSPQYVIKSTVGIEKNIYIKKEKEDNIKYE